jgi:hypothetical protein
MKNDFMMIKKLGFATILLILVTNFNIYSQGTGLFTSEEWEKANTAVKADYLSADEKEVFRYLNLARIDGARFYESFINTYIENNNAVYTPYISKSNKYLSSLKKDLAKIHNLPLIMPDERIFKASEFHANDMGTAGKTGHSSSDGTGFPDRMIKFLGTKYYLSENCCYGPDKGIDIVCRLLLDNGVPSLGHRKNILNPDQKSAGVSIRPHKEYEFNCVIDFYCGPPDFLKP